MPCKKKKEQHWKIKNTQPYIGLLSKTGQAVAGADEFYRTVSWADGYKGRQELGPLWNETSALTIQFSQSKRCPETKSLPGGSSQKNACITMLYFLCLH